MPTMSFRTAATTEDALAARKFRIVPSGGAILNVWASCVTITDTFGISIGNREIVVDGSLVNIEISTGVVDIARDHLVMNEVIPGGQLYLPVTVTTAMNFIIHLRYL